jgi:putative addiction module CopG family antidote
MQVTLTPPLEQFIHRQIERGYASPDEVVRAALIRWMDETDDTPPRLREKRMEAAGSEFRDLGRVDFKGSHLRQA